MSRLHIFNKGYFVLVSKCKDTQKGQENSMRLKKSKVSTSTEESASHGQPLKSQMRKTSTNDATGVVNPKVKHSRSKCFGIFE